MIPYFVPLSLKRVIPERVLDSIKAQTEPVETHKCRTAGEDDPNAGRTPLAVKGRLASRELCRQKAAEISPAPEYVIMADSCRASLDANNNYTPMINNAKDAKVFLDANKDFGAVSLARPSKGRKADDANPHICISWAIYRTEVFTKLKFDYDENADDYDCVKVTRQIRAMGLRFGYLDSTVRIMKV
jgi:hypothetical protein